MIIRIFRSSWRMIKGQPRVSNQPVLSSDVNTTNLVLTLRGSLRTRNNSLMTNSSKVILLTIERYRPLLRVEQKRMHSVNKSCGCSMTMTQALPGCSIFDPFSYIRQAPGFCGAMSQHLIQLNFLCSRLFNVGPEGQNVQPTIVRRVNVMALCFSQAAGAQ